MFFFDSLLFFKKFFTQYYLNASLRPTSSTAARLLVNSIDRTNVRTVVELGPGTWPITKYILDAMKAESEYIWIEYDQEYVDILKNRFPTSRAKFIQADVKDLSDLIETSGVKNIDVIISALPYKPFIEHPYLLQYIQWHLEKWSHIRCISYSPVQFQKVYAPLWLSVMWFTLRNLPPLYVMGKKIT